MSWTFSLSPDFRDKLIKRIKFCMKILWHVDGEGGLKIQIFANFIYERTQWKFKFLKIFFLLSFPRIIHVYQKSKCALCLLTTKTFPTFIIFFLLSSFYNIWHWMNFKGISLFMYPFISSQMMKLLKKNIKISIRMREL